MPFDLHRARPLVIVGDSVHNFIDGIVVARQVDVGVGRQHHHAACGTMLGQHGFLARAFQAFADCGVCVDLVATSEVSVCATVDGTADLKALQGELGKISSVMVIPGNAIISIVCAHENSGKAMSLAFDSLAASGTEVHAVSYGASKGNISLVVSEAGLVEGANAVHAAFFGGVAA